MKKALLFAGLILCAGSVFAQSLGNAGTIEGTVLDQSGAAVTKATVTLHNAVTGYSQSVNPAQDGAFRLVNIPPGQYHAEVSALGFAVFTQDVSIRGSVPVQMKVALALAGAANHGNGGSEGGGRVGNRSVRARRRGPQPVFEASSDGPCRWVEPGHYLQHRRCRGRWKRTVSSARRPRAVDVSRRRTTHQRPAKQGIFDAASHECDPKYRDHHGHSGRGIWRQDQPDRPSHDCGIRPGFEGNIRQCEYFLRLVRQALPEPLPLGSATRGWATSLRLREFAQEGFSTRRS